jgi:hypothetical protein
VHHLGDATGDDQYGGTEQTAPGQGRGVGGSLLTRETVLHQGLSASG